MKNIKRNLKLAGLALLVATAGCKKQTQETRVANNYNAPTASVGEGESIGILDWASVQKTNPGYNLDMNQDGKVDYVRLDQEQNGCTLYFGKDGDRNNIIPILYLKGNISAYTIGIRPDIERNSLIYFTPDGKGYLRKNLGTNENGIPYFGDVEEVK